MVVARRNRNVFRKILIQGSCGLRKELAAASLRMTHDTKVARRGRYEQDDVVKKHGKDGLSGRDVGRGPERNSGIRDQA
jgi:hypothetical protein